MSELGALPVQAYLLACLLAGGLGLWVARLAWDEREVPGGVEVALYAGAVGAFALLYSIRVASGSPGVMLFALQVSTPILAAIPVLWFLFALAYAGHGQWRTERVVVALSAPSFVWLVLAWSSGTHGLARQSLAPVSDGPFTLIGTGVGPVGLLFTLYAYALFVGGIVLLLDLYRRTGNRYRLQTFVAVLGTLFPLLAGVVTVVNVGSFARLEWTPVAFGVHAVFLYWTVFWLGTLDAAVVARDTAVEVMQDPVIVSGDDGRIRDLNPAAERLFSPDAVGEPLAEAVPPLEAGDQHPLTIAGRKFDVQEDPITDQRGADRGHVFLLRDVTARERRQSELKRREEQLRQQNERLEEFAGVVSHDLRNPLAAASAAVELARHRSEGGDESLDRAAAAHRRMDDLIEGLLSLATAGKAVDEVDDVAVGPAVRTAWSRLETGEATLVADDVAGTVRADADRFEQLVTNLFRNAIEHGGDHVTVTVVTEPDGEGGLRMVIADDGPGIPDEERDRVFERGVSLGGGTGLGLSIVGDVAEAHDWTISTCDGPTDGACFEVTGMETAS